jgi:hypothetical protein
MVNHTVVIEEVLGRSPQGKTEPLICRGDDGETYYVKGAGAGRRSLICEWVAAHLATAFGLPMADYAMAQVPVELVSFGVRADIREFGAGLVFASRRLPHVQELTPTTRVCRHSLNSSTRSSSRRVPPSPSRSILFLLITCTPFR